MAGKRIELSPEEWNEETMNLLSILFLMSIHALVDKFGREKALEILAPSVKNVTYAGAKANIARFNLDAEDMEDIVAAFCHIKKCFRQELRVLECGPGGALLEVTYCPFEASGLEVCELLEISANDYLEGLNPRLEGHYETARGRGDGTCRYRIVKKRRDRSAEGSKEDQPSYLGAITKCP